MRGVIVRMIPIKGFGFIRSDDDNVMRFFHAKDCPPGPHIFDRLREGQNVEFKPGEGPKGALAKEVRAISPVDRFACPDTGDLDCKMCSGDHCSIHGHDPCICDILERHKGLPVR